MTAPYQGFPPALLTLSPCVTRTSGPASSVQGLNTAPLPDGALVYCLEDRSEYQLDKADSTSAASVTVIVPSAGPGRWRKRLPASGSTVIAWRPDGTGDATTWAEVMVLVAASIVAPVIDVAPQTAPYVIPASPTPYALKSATFSSRIGELVVVDVSDGAVLLDLSTVGNSVGLRFHPTAGAALTFTPVPNMPAVLVIQRGGRLQNQGTVPVYTAQPSVGGPGFVLASFENGNIDSGATPLIALAPTALVLFEVISAFNTGGVVPPDIFSGPVGTTVLIVHDGTLMFPFTVQTAFAGTLLNVPLGCSPSGGPTAMRPTAAIGPLSIGVSYFDTGIATPRLLTWNGTDWVDGAGVVVP